MLMKNLGTKRSARRNKKKDKSACQEALVVDLHKQ